MIEQQIENMVQKLPFYLKREVLNYIEYISNKHHANRMVRKKFRFDWEGGLEDVEKKMTSVQLQHKAMDWR